MYILIQPFFPLFKNQHYLDPFSEARWLRRLVLVLPVWLSSCSIGVNNFFVIIITILIILIFLIIIILINVQVNNLSSQFFLMVMIIILIIAIILLIIIILLNIQVNNFSNQSFPLSFSFFTGSNRFIASSTALANIFYMMFPIISSYAPLFQLTRKI